MTEEQKKLKLLELDKTRRNLNILIGEWIDRNKSPRDIKFKVRQYEDITSQMLKLGSNVCIRAPQLHSEYWDNHTVEDYKKSKNKPILSHSSIKNKSEPTVIVKEVQKIASKSYFILNVCWSDFPDIEHNNVFNEYILPYLKYIGIKKIREDRTEFDDHIENIEKCEYYGYEEDFNLLKKTISYIIQINNITDMDCYGKKRN